ncbi:MAG: M24 family metallopeptidase [Candidatus Hodarchaeota archaeon]
MILINYRWDSRVYRLKIVMMLFLMLFSGTFLIPGFINTEKTVSSPKITSIERKMNSQGGDLVTNPSRNLKNYANNKTNNQIASEISSIALLDAKHFLEQAYNTKITQMDLIHHLESILHAEGADPGLSFSTIVYSGTDHLQLHANPLDDYNHIITPGIEPVVTIDLGSKYQGQCSDVTRTFFFESATQEMLDAYQVVLDTHNALLDAMKPGVAIYDLDLIYRNYLKDYFAREDVYIHHNWGHGVGKFVHEYPALNNKTDDTLFEGQILAVEPGIFFDAGWSVRVEDTVMVTASGVEIFSNVPVEIEDVTIIPNITPVDVQITNENYKYTQNTTIFAYLDYQALSIQSVSFYDGYNWYPMDEVNSTMYKHIYTPDYSYSDLLTGIVKVNLVNETIYFSKELKLEFDNSNLLERDLELMGSNTSGILEWEINDSEADLIRIHFQEMISPVWDQLVIMDKHDKIIYDYRCRGNLVDIWSPLVAGPKITLKYFKASQYWVDRFEFRIDKVEYFNSQEATKTTGFAVLNALILLAGAIACLAIMRVSIRKSSITPK